MNKNLKHVKRLLVVVDLVNGFVTEGSMADPFIQHILPEGVSLVKKFLSDGNAVMYVKESHSENCTEFKRFPKHCKKDTYEAQMVDELTPYEDEVIVVKKNCTSAIFAKGFLETVNQMKELEEVVIIGCCTDICVLNLAVGLQNYFDEHNKDIQIVVPKNAVETYDAPTHSRVEYNEIAFKILTQTGIVLVNNY